MADTRTLAEVRNDARARADMEAGGSLDFVTNPVANTWINLAIAELRGIMIGEYGDDWLAKYGTPAATSGGVDLYALPVDFYKFLGVDFSLDGGTNWLTAHRFELAERNFWGRASWGKDRVFYRGFGANVMFRPLPDGIYTYRLLYAPTITRLVNDSDPFDYVHGWDDWVACRVAIRMRQKEQNDATDLVADLALIMQRIAAEVRNRDAGAPKRVQDTMRRAPDRIIADLLEEGF